MKNLLLIALMVLTSCGIAQKRGFKNLSEKDGKIGIGTTLPDELLTVKGKIHTQEVLVDLEGAVAPDYVFERYYEGTSETKPQYERLSLTAIETFIKQHHHLPGIPSAQELDKNGMSLKEMNLVLLEKIEELTMFVIEQQKEIDTLKGKIHSPEK
ncbi:MAG: tail fiber protein [Flavobacteriaceae bacterium]